MNSSESNEQLKIINARLARIERVLDIPKPVAVSSPQPVPPKADVPQRTSLYAPTTDHGEISSGTWLAIVAVICFILAAGFIIKLSVESGWLTPARQIGLAALLGLGLIGSGLQFLKADKEYAGYLPAAGILILYLTVFAAHQVYNLITFEMAMGDIAIVSCMCIWLYTEIRNGIYPIILAVGAYVSPIYLGLHEPTEFVLYYFVLCSLAFAIVSIWVESRLLMMISAYLAMVVNAFLNLIQPELIAGVLIVHFLIFSIGAYLYTKQNHCPLTSEESWGFFPVLILFYAAEYTFLERVQPSIAPWISLGFAGVLMSLYLWTAKWLAEKQQVLSSTPMILAFVTVVCFHSIYLELIPIDLRPWIFVVIMLGVGLCPLKILNKEINNTYLFPISALCIILSIEYGSMLVHLADLTSSSWMIVSLASLVSIWFVLVMQTNILKQNDQTKVMLLGAAHLLAIMAFYHLTDYNSFAVSVSWLIYAICVILFAFTQQDKIMAKSALFVLSFAAAKALLYDASSAPTLARIFCLLATGTALYGSGFLLRKIDKWKN